MTAEPNEFDPPPWPQAVLRSTDQAVAAVITAVSLLGICAWCLWQWQLGGRMVDIERSEPVAIDFRIDVNRADWPELAMLPNIGEQLARRIVADRTQNGPFHDLRDLRRVRGIGPRTLETIEPFLQPLSQVEATAGSQAVAPPQAGN